MAIAVLPDQDLEELLDHEVPCDQEEGCDRPGEWLYVLICCGSRFVLCTPHHEFAQDVVPVAVQYAWRCSRCKTDFPRGVIPFRLISRI